VSTEDLLGSVERRAGGGLAILAIAQFLIALDYSIVYVALPSIGAELRLGENILQWVISGYTVFFAGFLIVGGRAADRFGARNLFIGALLLFGAASLAGGFATGPAMLLVARATQGIAAAVLQPATLALINTSFPAGAERHRALAVWGTVGAVGLAAGALLGGLLTTASWRWVFFINFPLTVICAIAAPALLAVAPGRSLRVPLNVPSAVLVTATVLMAVLDLTWAAVAGWTDVVTGAGMVVTLLLLGGFLLRERMSTGPLVDPALRRTRTLLVGCGAAVLYMASVGNEFFLLTLLFQQLRGYGPLQAGLAFLPLVLCISLGSTIAGRIAGPLGIRRSLALAFSLDGLGLLLIVLRIHGHSYVLDLLPGLIISGVGHGMTFTGMFIAGTQDVANRNQGVGSALMTTAQYIGGALGIAVLVLILGPAPRETQFLWAFVATAAAALAGAVVVWRGLRSVPGPAAVADVAARGSDDR
jgi:EmrB/QacA subfamily drug resistance transporter